jgi:hypothetical protein
MVKLAGRLVAVASVAVMGAAACGTGGPAGTSAGSCAGPGSPSGYMRAARTVFVGVMLPGPTVGIGGRSVLASPARMRVVRYLKGHGPAVVTVSTGVTSAGGGATGSEDGIEPRAGERWRIYSASRHAPYQTSICFGSARAGRAR